MLQDIKKLQACKTAKILTAFLILHQKKQLLIFLTMLTQTDYVIISLLNTVIEKKIKLGKQNARRQMSGWVSCAKTSRRNTDPGVSRTFSLIFFPNYSKYISDVVSKILEKKKTQLSDVLSEFVIFLKLGLL